MLVLQITKPVRWKETMDNIIKYGAKAFVEIGPRKVLGNMIDDDKKHFPYVSFCTSKDVDQVKMMMENQNDHSGRTRPDFSSINQLLDHSVVMKNYNSSDANYNEIHKIYQKINDLKNNDPLNSNRDRQIIQYILKVFALKNIPSEEQENFKNKWLREYA
jgi:[acyl-carrier-protein] S-malonyltransferase